jgi:hypothetical protein
MTSQQVLEKVKSYRNGRDERVSKYLSAVRDFARPMLNGDGSWNIELTSESGRLDLQLCTAFYCGDSDDIALANKLTRRAPVCEFEVGRFNIFQTSIACHHLAVFGNKMEEETIAWCRSVIEDGCHACPGMPAPDIQFHGYNDNMPAMATKTLILGGEILARNDLFEVGLWKLRRFAEQLSRHGLISEYNSPNYTPDTIHNLMSVVKYSKDNECKKLAEKIVIRIWKDLACHWHPEGRCPAGPFSRAYAHDFNNYLSSLNCLAWFIFGSEVSGVSAMETIKPRRGIEPMHGNDPLEHSVRMAWYALTDDSLLDDETAVLFLDKPENYEITASTLQGDSHYSPLRKTTATSFINKDYSIGSASYAFCGGEQTTSLYVTGRGDEVSPVLGTRYLTTEEYPGNEKENDWHYLTTGEAECYGAATSITVQHQKTAMLSCIPHRQLAEKDLSYLRLALVAPSSVGQFGGFFDADGNRLKENKEYPADCWYGAELGEACAAFYPLAYAAIDIGNPRVMLRKNDRYNYLELINYKGKPRKFSSQELSEIINGLVVEIASASKWENLSSFISAVSESAVFEDQFIFRTRRLRYYRGDIADRDKTMLGLSYSTSFDGVAERVINGLYAPEPAWQCTGTSRETLPLMNGDQVIAPAGLPWSDLKVHWFPEEHWAIHAGGK